MSNVKTFKKGEYLLREGDRNPAVYLIQSGLVSVCLPKGKKTVEIYRATTGHVLGDEALFAPGPSPFSVIALNETKALEIPGDLFKQQIEASPQGVKLLFKGLGEKIKATGSELRAVKNEADSVPCPPDNTAKVFGVIYHTANYTGVKKDGKVTVSWPAFKKYAQRVFLESPIRLEQACYVLVKLKMAEMQMVKNETAPDAPDELGFFHFSNLTAVEKFFEFYQNYHFRGSNTAILRYDEKCYQTAAAMVKVSEGEPVDKNGVVYLNLKGALDKLKDSMGPTFNPDAISRLEQKGLFVKKTPNDKGGQLSFFRAEFEEMLVSWKILREIEKWNEKGYVDPKEEEPKPQPQAAPGAAAFDPNKPVISCPTCMSIVTDTAKFCSACGTKLGQEAA